jgi:hypothetical protein
VYETVDALGCQAGRAVRRAPPPLPLDGLPLLRTGAVGAE